MWTPIRIRCKLRYFFFENRAQIIIAYIIIIIVYPIDFSISIFFIVFISIQTKMARLKHNCGRGIYIYTLYICSLRKGGEGRITVHLIKQCVCVGFSGKFFQFPRFYSWYFGYCCQSCQRTCSCFHRRRRKLPLSSLLKHATPRTLSNY